MRRALAAALLLAAAAACRRGPETVLFHYERTVEGRAPESTFGGDPVRARLEAGELLPALEAALAGMRPGEERVLAVTAPYGPRDASAVETMPLAGFGELGRGLKPGAKVHGLRRGVPARAIVQRIDGGTVTLDFNHPDAGKPAVFRLRLVDRR